MTQLQHPPILGTSQATWPDEPACAREAQALARAPALRDAFVAMFFVSLGTLVVP